MKNGVFSLIAICICPPLVFSWEPYDRVIAVVNNMPIIESEITNKLNQLKQIKAIPPQKFDYEKSRILDKFIEDSLVLETANDQSIYVSDVRVMDHIEKIATDYFKRSANNADIDKQIPKIRERLKDYIDGKELNPKDTSDARVIDFISFLSQSQKIDLISFFDEIRSQMRKEQVMSIAIGVSPPSHEECTKWYNDNKNKLGFEVKIKNILIRPAARTLEEEKKANELANNLRQRINSGESFDKIAAQYSQDTASASKGGDLDWVMLADLDPYFAGYVYSMTAPGQLSTVFKSSFGYHIVKYFGRRTVTFEKVERMIMYKLYNDNLQTQFEKWVLNRKKESEIKIFMDNYLKI
jgi:parvulin-like peptidyl-prolyl isomerase